MLRVPAGLPAAARRAVRRGPSVPAPGMRGAVGKVRERLYNVVTESVPLPTSRPPRADGNGHGEHAVEGDGHAAPAEVPAARCAPGRTASPR